MRSRLIVTAVMAVVATAFTSPVVGRQAMAVREYVLPHQGAFAHDPAVGADGIVWFADQPGSYIGRLDPETGDVKEFPTPTPGSGPHGIIVAPDGAVWYTGNAKGLIARLDPKSGKITEFPTGARDPHTLLWLNGTVWFTAQQANKYGSLNAATGQVKLYDVATTRALPYGLQRAPDGSLWIALFGTNKLGHLDPATAKLIEIDLPNAATRPRRLAVTSDGRDWYSDYARGYLGMYDPKSKATREWKTPNDNSNPYGIGVAPNGMIWVNEARQGTMVMFNPATEKMEVVTIPTRGSVIRNVTVDSTRRRLWIAESGVSRIGRIDLK
jgi:virginiamycin B lyase